MNSIDERIAELRADMLPLQRLYGLKSRTIEERYQEIEVKKKIKNNKPQYRLPKL